MIIKVYFKDKDGKDTEGLLVSSHFQHNIQTVYAFVAKADGTFENVRMDNLWHKQEFI